MASAIPFIRSFTLASSPSLTPLPLGKGLFQRSASKRLCVSSPKKGEFWHYYTAHFSVKGFCPKMAQISPRTKPCRFFYVMFLIQLQLEKPRFRGKRALRNSQQAIPPSQKNRQEPGLSAIFTIRGHYQNSFFQNLVLKETLYAYNSPVELFH